ncbi:MAG: fibronectin type III domain-containing protein, partial [Microbacterium sp.]
TITISRGSVIGGESISVTGTLGMKKARPVVLQRQSAGKWVNVTPSRSTTAGAFRFLFKPPTKVGTKTVIRVIAPRTTIAGRTYAQITTGGRSVLTVAQKATMTAPSVVSQDAAFTIKGTFTPARTAREVVVQKPVNGTWVKVGTSRFESSTGTVTFPMVLKTQGTFQFRVTALAANGAPAVASAPTSVPVSMPVPTGLAATPGNASAQVSWNAVTATGLLGYNVFRRTDPGDLAAGWTQVNTNPVAGTSLNVTGLTNGTTYYFTVTSVSASDESAFAPKVSAKPVLPADTTPPPPPTAVGADPGSGSVLVSWTPPATGEPTGYKVYRATSASGPWTLLTTNPVTGSAYNATGLTNGTEYF